MVKLPKIKRFGDAVVAGDYVKIAKKWETLRARFLASDLAYITGGTYSETLCDQTADTHLTLTQWQFLQGVKLEVRGSFKGGERLLVRAQGGLAFPISRLVIK